MSRSRGTAEPYVSNTIGIISALLHGYSGGITIVREMAQNADDADGDDDRWLELHFDADRLTIKNSTVFRPVDFANIKKIANGGKKLEARNTIGMFGVGFLSVYQLTDTPILRSAGREVMFVPGEGMIYQQDIDVLDHSEFELPYRRSKTPVGQELGMPEVTDDWIREVLAQLPIEAYRLLFFLRRLSRVAVFEHGALVCEARRTTVASQDAAQPDLLEIEMVTRGEPTERHAWLRFTGEVKAPAPRHPDGRPAKDRVVQIAIPGVDVPDAFLRDRMAGRLYNYLPTEIPTALPFQINGDFYPSTDRKSIDNDHPNHQDWNAHVLHALGACLADALPALLDHFDDEPLKLYQRLPIKGVSSLVQPIADHFVEAARTIPVFYTAQGWRIAADARRVRRELRPVVEQVETRLMAPALQNAAWELMLKLGVPEYSLSHFLDRLVADFTPGQSLNAGPNYLCTPEQLDLLYSVLDQDFVRDSDARVKQTPIFLDHKGHLWPPEACVQSTQADVQEALFESGLHFWQGAVDELRHLAALVPRFSLGRLFSTLRSQIPREVALADAPDWLNTRQKLYRLYDAILKTREQLNRGDVATLPLCLTREEQLRRPATVRMPDGEPILYEILAEDPASTLVSKATQENKRYRRLYEDMGVAPFQCDELVDRLGKLAKQEILLSQAHPCFNSREKLLRVYRYLRDHSAALAAREVHELRHRLPIWLCRDNVLRFAKGLSLPPAAGGWPHAVVVDRVVAVEPRDGLHSFFVDVLELRPLDAPRFIQQYLLKQYAELKRSEQIEALQYLRSQVYLLHEQGSLRQTVQNAALIRGDDDALYCARDLCFPQAGLQTLFGSPVRVPHRSLYGEPPRDAAAWQWYELFRLLGMNLVASEQLVLQEVDFLTQRRPRETRDGIEKLFRYLEQRWEQYYRETGLGMKLRGREWLPADGDSEHWHRPRLLYPRQDKPLVSHVAKVLGFTDARRPQRIIADALEFPSAPDNKLVVRQLLALSECGEQADKSLYQRLNSAHSDDLKPLRSQPVIYDERRGRYWRADHIFLSNQLRQFGAYRGYFTSGDFRALLEKLGAKENPQPKDYLDLICEISTKQWDSIPDEEAGLLVNAYAALANEPVDLIGLLRSLPCVLTVRGDGTCVLRMPQEVVFRPPDRYLEQIPDLPVARYDVRGEAMLRELGVRVLDEVLDVKFEVEPDTSQPFQLVAYFGVLQRVIKRLLHHFDQLEREPEVIERLKSLHGYYVPAIQVIYRVQLGERWYQSKILNEDVFYARSERHVYLREHLTERDKLRALVQVFHQVLGIDQIAPALLKELLKEPRSARQILDDNHIRTLPDEPGVNPLDDTLEEVAIGAVTSDELVVTDDQAFDEDSPVRTATPAIFVPEAHQADLFAPDTPELPAGLPPFSDGHTIHPGRSNGHVRAPNTNGMKSNGSTPRSIPGQPRCDTPSTGSTQASGNGESLSTTWPDRNLEAPAFTGRTAWSSPRIQTDMDGLRDRVERWMHEREVPMSEAPRIFPAAMPRRRGQVSVPTEPVEEHVVRFILSYPERAEGFLRIAGKAANLFLLHPTRVSCVTDFGHQFPLWLDWKREIAYNQEALRAYFEDQEIPAGGIVYLERLHAEEYRLYYHLEPHMVPEVHIAFNDLGQVRYEIIDEVVVNCETDQAIYRAEKRYEDLPALWLEAVGKRSVEETLCDLLMTSPEPWIHQDDLMILLNAERRVAASTVRQTLESKPFFVGDSLGNWRLDPTAILNPPQNDLIHKWRQATHRLLACDDTVLTPAIDALQPPLHELRARLRHLDLWQSVPAETGELASLMEDLNAQPHNELLAHGIERVVGERLAASNVNLFADKELHRILATANDEVWRQILRPLLRGELVALQQAGEYTRTAQLAQVWSEFDEAHGIDLARLAREAQAWSLIASGQPTVMVVMHAIELAPTLAAAREKLHLAVQLELPRYGPDYWLAQGNDDQAVGAFYGYIDSFGQARQYLRTEHQTAFDHTVEQEAARLWKHVNDINRIRMVFVLQAHAPTAMPSKLQLEHLVDVLQQQFPASLDGLLLGLVAWKIVPDGHYLRPRIAAHLAGCHISLRIWELANHRANRGWKQLVEQRLARLLEEGCRQHSTTHLQREQAFLLTLGQPHHSPVADVLVQVWDELRELVTRDVEALAASAA